VRQNVGEPGPAPAARSNRNQRVTDGRHASHPLAARPSHWEEMIIGTIFLFGGCATALRDCERGRWARPQIPTIVLGRNAPKRAAAWRDPLQRIIDGHPTWTEVDIAWKLIEEMALKAAGGVAADLRSGAGRKGASRCRPIRRSIGCPSPLSRRRCISTAGTQHSGEGPGDAAGLRDRGGHVSRGERENVSHRVPYTVPESIAVAEAVERGP